MNEIRALFVDVSPEPCTATQSLALLLGGLEEAGISPCLFCSRPDLYKGEIPPSIPVETAAWEGFRDVRSEKAGLESRGWLDALTAKKRLAKFGRKVIDDFDKTIGAFKPDLVHLYGLSAAMTPFADDCADRSLPLLVHVHENRVYQNRDGGILQKAGKVLVCGQPLQNVLNEQFPEVYYKRYERFLMPVDADLYGPEPDPSAKTAFGLAQTDPVILVLGPVKEHLGQEDVFTAFTKVGAVVPDARLWFAGADDEPFTADLKRSVAQSALSDRVSFFDKDTPLNDLCRASDLAVFAPRYDHPEKGELPGEYMDVAVAMANGLPVVTTDAGCTSQIVLGSGGGAVVPPGDPQSLASAVTAYLQKTDLRKEASRAARRRIENGLGVKRAAVKLAEIYGSLLNR